MYNFKRKISGQISIIPKPELRGFWGSSLIKPPFGVTSADVIIICPGTMCYFSVMFYFVSLQKSPPWVSLVSTWNSISNHF